MKRITGFLTGLTAAAMLCAAAVLHVHADAPDISAKSCVLMDAQTAQTVWGLHENEKRPMASTTKIMTTLLTLESGDLDTPFTVDSEAIHVEGSSMGLQDGDTVTKRALCTGMLLPSGNDAANASAVAVAGSIPAFLSMMNARAAEIGMTHAYFASPSGLDADGHGASASDMALLTRIALQNETFAEICAKQSASVSFGDPPFPRTLYNTNKLLGMDPDIIGVKTGFTDAAGRCLVSACRRNGRTLICVTLSDRNDWADHLALYDYGFALAQPFTLPQPALSPPALEGSNETALPVYIKETPVVTAWGGMPPEYTVRVLLPPFVTAPVRKGDQVGEVVYTCQKAEIARLPVCAAQDADSTSYNTKQHCITERLYSLFRRAFL